MKKLKLFASMLAIVMVSCLIFGCNKQEIISDATTGDIKVTIVDKGYGVDWLYNIADAYEETHPGCTVSIAETSDPSALASKIRTNANDNDLVISAGTNSGFFNEQYEGFLLEVSDIYQTSQEGYEQSLYDRMNISVRDYYESDDGKFYQLPWVLGYSGMLYNKTVLDDIFGKDAYQLPRTTNELYDLCKEIKAKGVYPFSFSTQVSYWNQFMVAMYYQYEGAPSYDKFYEGYYLKGGEFVKATNDNYKEYLESQDGVEKAYEIVYSLLGKDTVNGVKGGEFGHPNADYLTFQEAQEAFAGSTVSGDSTKCAFMINGDWFANEMSKTISQNKVDIRFMKMPVISCITETLEDKSMTEEELIAVIDAIDEGKTSYGDVSANDFARIKKARYSAAASSTSHVMAIPKMKNGVRKYTLTKQFLNYMLSEEGQELFTYTTNGLVMPYGYIAEGIYGDYADSLYEAMGDPKEFTVISEGHGSPLYYIGGLDIIGGYYEGLIYSENKLPDQYFRERINAANLSKAKVLPLIK